MADDFEREPSADSVSSYLLRVAHEDRPSQEARQRAMVALGLSTAAVAVSSTAAAASTAAGSVVAGSASGKGALSLLAIKWGGSGLLAGLVSMGVAHQTGLLEGPAKPPISQAETNTQAQAFEATPARERRSKLVAGPAETAPPIAVSPAPVVVEFPGAGKQPSAPPAQESPVAASPDPRDTEASSLLPEISSLDRVRKLLNSGDPNGALRALREHERTFRGGALSPEAAVLRIEALLDKGNRATALTLAEQFQINYPRSPLRERVRVLTGGHR